MSFWKEFEVFALRGNVVDMAIGIIVGASFTKVVNSLVDDLLIPPLGLLVGGMDFSEFVFTLPSPFSQISPITIHYGSFLNTLVSFLIIAFAVFLIVKGMNILMRRIKKEENVVVKKCPECCLEIPKEAKRCGYCGIEFNVSP